MAIPPPAARLPFGGVSWEPFKLIVKLMTWQLGCPPIATAQQSERTRRMRIDPLLGELRPEALARWSPRS